MRFAAGCRNDTGVPRIGGVGRPVGIVIFQPAVRTVVYGEAEYRHIIGIHYAMNKADALPMHYHFRVLRQISSNQAR